MRKTKVIKKTKLKADSKYHSILITKFINYTMRDGKKSIAKKIVYSSLSIVENELKVLGDKAFLQAVENVAPTVEVRSRRVGGATYQVPMEVRSERKTNLALRWLLQAARDRQGKPMDVFLGEEIINAYNKTGYAIKKREDMHKSAEANKAFSHFARY